MRQLPCVLTMACVLVSAAAGQAPTASPQSRPAATSPESLGERLDEPIAELSLSACPLPEALRRLSEASGVTLVLDNEVPQRLPYGAATKLANLTIRDSTLREILPKMLAPLGLAHREEGHTLRIVCSLPMVRMEERANWIELKLLANLCETPYTPEEFKKLSVRYRISAKVTGPPVGLLLAEQAAEAGRGTLAQVLETATNALGWTWFVDDDAVIVVTRQAAIARAMSERVSGHYDRRNLGEILFALGREADVHVFLQPGTFKVLPPHVVDSYSLDIQNTSIRQALDYIAATTGLAYRIESDGVHVGPAEDIAKISAAAAAGPADDPYVAKLVVPARGGAAYEFLFRQSELPADLLALRRKVLKDFIAESRQPSAASHPAAGAGS